MNENKMSALDVPRANLAACFVTIGNRRYNMLNGKDFEAKANVKTEDVPMLCRLIQGKRPVSMSVQCKMTVYKCSDMFDELVMKFKETGVFPTFDVQVTQEDNATAIGKSTKRYTDCVIDGDVLLSMFNAEGKFIEQEITFYAMDFEAPRKYSTPDYM